MKRVVAGVGILGVVALVVAAIIVIQADLRKRLDSTEAALQRAGNQLERARDELKGTHDELEKARLQRHRLSSEVARWKDRLDRAVLRATEAELSLAGTQAALRELALVDGSQECSYPDPKETRVRVLSPRVASVVESPLLVHLLTVEPLGCDATYWLSVDGTPYLQLGPRSQARPLGPRNPQMSRPLPKPMWPQACVSGTYNYVLFNLQPGYHVLRVNGGCPQGTQVPLNAPTRVRLEVASKR
jgi:hypothetical protein